jgi:PAS domain S-box-containing protein
MITSVEQIQIFYEISMSIGNNLDLRQTVKTTLFTYLKKLNCSSGVVLQVTKMGNGKFEYNKVYSIPRNIEIIKNYKEAFNKYMSLGKKEDYNEFIAGWPFSFSHSDGQSSYIMNLPDFGILFLSTNLNNFDDYIINSVIQLNTKFAQACTACLQNEALQKNEEKYRRIFEESQDVIFVSSVNGEFLDINSSGLRLFGYSSLDEINKIDIANDLYKTPQDRQKYQQQFQKNGFVKEYESNLKKKDGSELIVIESTTPIYDDNKNIIAYRGIMHDVTEKKNLERQLAQSLKMESVGTLAGGIAHDFNNLLTVINGYAEMLLIGMDNDNPLHKDIVSILKAGKRAENLTSQLLAFSRKQIYKTEILGINQTISLMDKMLRRLIGEDISMNKVLAENLPKIKADKSQLEQIFMNLVLNARDAIRAVANDSFQKKITIETGLSILDKNFISKHPGSQEGHHVFFSVSDNGVGMDEQTKLKVFEPFFTTKEKYKGTGLGLAMVYGIVKQNSGSVYIYSEPGKGSMFKIYWPVTEEESKAEDTTVADENISGTESILVVEDEVEVCRFASEALKSLGYKVLNAVNGQLALDLIKNDKLKFDIIVTDLIMPELNGKEFIEKVKKIYQDVKVIYVSGYTDNHIVHDGLLEKDVNFIHKPYSLKKLAGMVRKVIDTN